MSQPMDTYKSLYASSTLNVLNGFIIYMEYWLPLMDTPGSKYSTKVKTIGSNLIVSATVGCHYNMAQCNILHTVLQ